MKKITVMFITLLMMGFIMPAFAREEVKLKCMNHSSSGSGMPGFIYHLDYVLDPNSPDDINDNGTWAAKVSVENANANLGLCGVAIDKLFGTIQVITCGFNKASQQLFFISADRKQGHVAGVDSPGGFMSVPVSCQTE